MIVIVTDRVYIVADRINFIIISEETKDIAESKYKTVYKKYFTLRINYVSNLNSSSNSYGSSSSLSSNREEFIDCEVGTKREVSLLFREIIQQIREQSPDVLFLDKALESMLTKEIVDDADTTEICSSREEKRRDKKILRGVKSRTRRAKK